MTSTQLTCDILHGNDNLQPVDNDGCILADNHSGPHEFIDPSGQHWLWETDLSCECDHCLQCEGDYCTTHWRKPHS
jgi:hypothetical protein